MSLILLGILNAQAAPAAAGGFDLLETQELASSAASITFSSLDTLAANYKHLQLRLVGRTTWAGDGQALRVQFNGDTGANYSRHYLRATNTVSSAGAGSLTYFFTGQFPGTNPAADIFGASVLDILDFSNTSKNTTARSLGGMVDASIPHTHIYLDSGAWYNTAAVTSITLFPTNGSLDTDFRISLYGIR